MQTHPVPQNIAQYEFKLVGDMTLKQFMFLAIGALLGLAVWKLPIPFWIVRFVLAIIPAGGGVLAAFVPINGRPFAAWVTAFFRAIYAPTQYDYEPPAGAKIILDQAVISKPLSPIPAKPVVPITQALGIKPKKSDESTAPPLIVPEATKKVEIIKPSIAPKETTSSVMSTAPPPPQTTPAPNEALSVPKGEVGPHEDSLFIPAEKPSATPRFTPLESKDQVKVVSAPAVATHTPPPQAPTANLTSSIATPTQPNILTGLVVDPNQVSLANATVEIIDSKTGIPTRALRTNRLGQFQIAIPLPSGAYTLEVEKEGFKFSPVSVTVNNSIVKPIIITATMAEPTSSTASPIPDITNNQVTKF